VQPNAIILLALIPFPVFYSLVDRVGVKASFHNDCTLKIHRRDEAAYHQHMLIRHANHPLEAEVKRVTKRAAP